MDKINIDFILSLDKETLYEKAIEFKNKIDHDNYIIYLTHSANLGYILAIRDLCRNHCYGNYNNTRVFYEQTKTFGYSLFMLGYIYEFLDINQAKEYYEKSIELENGIAAYHLGNMYCNSNGIDKAIQLYEISLKFGYGGGACKLADIYYVGSCDVISNFDKAIQLYEIGIELGYGEAAFNLGQIYEFNKLMKDYDKAIQLYKKSIELGDYSSISYLASFYDRIGYKYTHKIEIIDYFMQINSMDKLVFIYNLDELLQINNLTKELKSFYTQYTYDKYKIINRIS